MAIDWENLFVPQTPLWEFVLRGTVIYFVLLAALRVLVRRHIGSMSLIDLLLMVLIADAAQNAMADEYHSLTEGLVLCGTLIAWNYFFDFLAYRYEWFQKLLEPSPLPVVRDGKMLLRNMRREYITKDEIEGLLRELEIHNLSDVKVACVESDGGISVERVDGSKSNHSQRMKKKASALR
jgi:uncharacterized membrane protein YcaP (DUF421 family)